MRQLLRLQRGSWGQRIPDSSTSLLLADMPFSHTTNEIFPDSTMSECGKAANMGEFSLVSNGIPGELSVVCCGCSPKSALKRSKTDSNISATGRSPW